MVLAETFSRGCLSSHNDNRSETEKDTEVVHMANHIDISAPNLKEVQQATFSDETLKDVIKIIVKGWPANKDDLHLGLRPYFQITDEIATQVGTVPKGCRAITPKYLCKKIREKLHVAHTGNQTCLGRAHQVVYWPGMNKDLTDYVAKCDTYKTVQRNQQKEQLLSHEMST